MRNYTFEILGGLIKIAYRKNGAYYFFLHHSWRSTSVGMFFVFCFLGFVFLYIKDFELNIYFYLYFAGISLMCLALFWLSFYYVVWLSDENMVVVHHPFMGDKKFNTNQISHILRHTKTQYEWSNIVTNTRYYFCLRDGGDIQLCTLNNFGGLNYPINPLLMRFDTLMREISWELELEIITKREKWSN